MAEESEVVKYEVTGSVARITLNRPDKRNALNDALVTSVKNALSDAERVEPVRVILVGGAGEDFCSGADLSALGQMAKASVTDNTADARSLMQLFNQIRRVKIPVVAAVHGRALAGGCGLASACDIVLATKSARFGYPEVNIGFVPAMVMAILRRNLPEKIAFELITRGVQIVADEAKQIGLVNQVFSDDSFVEDVDRYVSAFEKLSKSAIGLTKSLLYQMDGSTFEQALEMGVDVNVIARMTSGCRNGIANFLRKR